MPEELYTYRAGRKIPLTKSADQIVARAPSFDLDEIGLVDQESVSPDSTRVTVAPPELDEALRRAREVAPAHHAYYEADTGAEFLITDRVLVRFRQAPAAAAFDAFTAKYALIALQRYSDRDFLFQLTDHTGMNPVKLVVLLNEQERDLVESAEHDLNQRMETYLVLPADPSYASQWHLHRRFQSPQVSPRSSSRCEEAWQTLGHFGSHEVVIGITDDGCKLDHPDFGSPGKFAGWGYMQGSRLVRMTDADADPARMYQAGANHGTSCAGVAAADVNAGPTVGAAPGCRLLPVKWESVGGGLSIADSKLLTALEFIADKVDVLSNSWGVVPRSLWSPMVTDRIRQLARTGGRRGKGILFLWAAGNDNCPIQHTAGRDVPYTSGWQTRPDGSAVWVGVRTARVFDNGLAGLDGVLHVAALSSAAQRSHYSNYGAGLALCAPTSNSHAYRRMTVTGLRVTTSTGQLAGVTETFGGTSSATPLAAGVAALVVSANPGLTALEVSALLKRSAAKDLDMTPYTRTPPAPAFDPDPAWDISPVAPFDSGAFQDAGSPDGSWSPWFGHGVVDAAAAVAAARGAAAEPAGAFSFASRPNLAIPDNLLAGVQDTILVNEGGQVREVSVEVNIRHTWIGDLIVRLVAPNGTAAVLHNRAGSSARDLRCVYGMASLAALAGAPLAGNWTLHAQDVAASDQGVLESWTLRLR